MLKKWMEKYIVAWAVQQLTIDNLKLVLSRCLEYLKVKAYQSEMKLDDWTIEILESIVNNEEKMLVIYNWLRQFVAPSDGVCRALPSDADLKPLGEQVMTAGENPQVCKAIPADAWTALLRMVIPFLVEYWRRRGAAPEPRSRAN